MIHPRRALRSSLLASLTCVLTGLAACGGKAGPSDAGAAPPTATDASAQPAPREAAAALALRWDSGRKSFIVRGLPPRPSAADPIVEAARAAGASRIVVGAPGDAAAADAPFVDLARALLELVDARLVVDGGVGRLTGHAFSPGQREAALGVVASALGKLAAPDGAPLRLDAALEVDDAAMRPGEGRIVLVGGATKVAELKPRRVVPGGPDAPDTLGEVAPIDDLGRIAAGLYELADGTSVAVVAGRQVTIKAGAPAIVVDGRRFVLDDDIPLTGMADPGGATFVDRKTPDDMPSYGPRYAQPGNPVKPGETAELRERVTEVVLHADLAATSAESFDAALARSLSQHFDIDFDGRVFQRLDLRECAYHAGDANTASVGIVLDNRMLNLAGSAAKGPDAQAPYDPRMARFEETKAHPRGGPTEATIQGQRVRSWGYTEAQYRSLAAILRRLADIFPAVGDGPPRGADGAVPMDAVTPMPTRGVLGHLHLEAQRRDPGPGFEWARVSDALARRELAPAPARPPLEPLPDLAPAGAASAAWKVELTWDRMKPEVGLAGVGLWNDGPIARSAADTAGGLGARVELLAAGRPALPDAQLQPLVDALLMLDEGTLELGPSAAVFRGRAHNRAVQAAVEKQVEGARQGASMVVGVTALDEAADAFFYPGEGGLRLWGGWDPMPTSLDALDGHREALDENGRIKAGTYKLPDGTVAFVRAGAWTSVHHSGRVVTVGADRLRLADPDIALVPLGASAAEGGLAFDVGGLPERSLADLLAHPPIVEIGADFAADARAGFARIAKQKALSHFLVDFDGTIIQTADVGRPLRGELGEETIVIALNNLLPNLEEHPDAAPYPAEHPRKAAMDANPRPTTRRLEINGVKVKSYGYTDAQLRALGALLAVLRGVNPAIAAGPPRDAKGKVERRGLYEPDPAHPLRARWHQSLRAWSPGPGLDWDALVKSLER